MQSPYRKSHINHTNCTEQLSLAIAKQYPSIFKEMGEFKGEVSIALKGDAKPYVQSIPRPVPIPFMSKLKIELDRLLSLNIIEAMHEVTEWVSPIVVVPKDNNEIRLCVDYTKLNESVRRPYFPIPRIESTLSNLKGAKFFSKVKAFIKLSLTSPVNYLRVSLLRTGDTFSQDYHLEFLVHQNTSFQSMLRFSKIFQTLHPT